MICWGVVRVLLTAVVAVTMMLNLGGPFLVFPLLEARLVAANVPQISSREMGTQWEPGCRYVADSMNRTQLLEPILKVPNDSR